MFVNFWNALNYVKCCEKYAITSIFHKKSVFYFYKRNSHPNKSKIFFLIVYIPIFFLTKVVYSNSKWINLVPCDNIFNFKLFTKLYFVKYCLIDIIQGNSFALRGNPPLRRRISKLQPLCVNPIGKNNFLCHISPVVLSIFPNCFFIW